MEPMPHRPCPLCGSTELVLLTTLSLPQPSTSPLPERYRLLGCEHCDFAYADTPAPQIAYDLYYQTQAKYAGATGTGAGQNATDATRLQELADRLKPWLPDAHTRVLDIGCGGGGLLQVLAGRGQTHCEGLDPDPAAVQSARQRGLKVAQGLVSDAHTLFAGQQFDLIVLSHVAEHLRDLGWVSKLSALLAPTGTLYVEVPNAERYQTGTRPKNYFFDSEHINHFGRRALFLLANSVGLMSHTAIECTLPLPDGSHYPALACASSAATPCANETTGPSALPSLRDYIQTCASQAEAVPDVSPPLPAEATLLIWGAGSFAQRLLGQGLIPLDRVAAFLDGNPNKQGLTLAGKPIWAPMDGLHRHPAAHVLVCIAIDPHQIEADIRQTAPGHNHVLHYFNHLT